MSIFGQITSYIEVINNWSGGCFFLISSMYERTRRENCGATVLEGKKIMEEQISKEREYQVTRMEVENQKAIRGQEREQQKPSFRNY